MRVERAIEILDPKHRERYTSIETVNEACRTGMVALEKQVPKPVTHEAAKHDICTCPNCKHSVDAFEDFGDCKVRILYEYCHFCGQRLRWSEND